MLGATINNLTKFHVLLNMGYLIGILGKASQFRLLQSCDKRRKVLLLLLKQSQWSYKRYTGVYSGPLRTCRTILIVESKYETLTNVLKGEQMLKF